MCEEYFSVYSIVIINFLLPSRICRKDSQTWLSFRSSEPRSFVQSERPKLALGFRQRRLRNESEKSKPICEVTGISIKFIVLAVLSLVFVLFLPLQAPWWKKSAWSPMRKCQQALTTGTCHYYIVQGQVAASTVFFLFCSVVLPRATKMISCRAWRYFICSIPQINSELWIFA